MKKLNVFDEGHTMKCPFRRKETYKVNDFNGRPVIVGMEEEYPNCYEYECPFFSAPNSCDRINSETEY